MCKILLRAGLAGARQSVAQLTLLQEMQPLLLGNLLGDRRHGISLLFEPRREPRELGQRLLAKCFVRVRQTGILALAHNHGHVVGFSVAELRELRFLFFAVTTPFCTYGNVLGIGHFCCRKVVVGGGVERGVVFYVP